MPRRQCGSIASGLMMPGQWRISFRRRYTLWKSCHGPIPISWRRPVPPPRAKLRGGARFDIKELLAREAGLELWRPVIAAEFPFDDEDRATLARLYPAIPHSLQSLAALRDAFLAEGAELTVDKKRQIATEPGGLRAEITSASLGEGARTTLCL